MSKPVDIQEEMRAFIARKYKTQTEAAKHWGCSKAFVSYVVNGNREPNEKMLEDAGFEKVEQRPVYVRIRK